MPEEKFILRISMIALSRSIDLELSAVDRDDFNILSGSFLMLFSKTIDRENMKINLHNPQQNNETLRINFNQFVETHREKEPRINQLNAYLKSLEQDEYFFLFVNMDIDTETHIKVSNILTAIKHGQDATVLQKQMDDLFKDFREKYEIQVFDKHTKKTIGERDKTKRRCRFCGEGQPKVTFKSEAHAISEALGNKQIILNEECDACNGKFGSLVEIHLIEYLRFFCVFFGIKGKEKIPEIKSPDVSKFPLQEGDKNFGITNDGGVKIEYFQTGEEQSQEGLPLNFILRSDKDVIDQSVYKTLCKYALSVIDTKHIPAFEDTIKWLNGEITVSKLPKVAVLVTNSFFDPHPRLTLYIRKNDDEKLPFLVGELNFTAYTFSFIIPLCKLDNTDFLSSDEYSYYWNSFKHYSAVKGWQFRDLSDNVPKKLKMHINLDQR